MLILFKPLVSYLLATRFVLVNITSYEICSSVCLFLHDYKELYFMFGSQRNCLLYAGPDISKEVLTGLPLVVVVDTF